MDIFSEMFVDIERVDDIKVGDIVYYSDYEDSCFYKKLDGGKWYKFHLFGGEYGTPYFGENDTWLSDYHKLIDIDKFLEAFSSLFKVCE